MQKKIMIFTDGAAKGNPGPAGWGTIVLAVSEEVTELGGREGESTNNRMELTAIIRGLRAIEAIPGEVVIMSDSQYALNGIQSWVTGWIARGWVTSAGAAVLNRDLWEELWDLTLGRKRLGAIEWRYVRGHSGTPGNERADVIASDFALGLAVQLYRGAFSEYGIDLHKLPPPEVASSGSSSRGQSKSGRGGGTPYYLSLIQGELKVHLKWSDCEARVKGVQSARFKKVLSEAEYAAVMKSWGVQSPPKSPFHFK